MLQRRNLLEFAVALTQNSLIFIIQPVTLLLIKQWHGLCIELAVVYGVYYVPQHGEDNVLVCGEDSVCFILCLKFFPCLFFSAEQGATATSYGGSNDREGTVRAYEAICRGW